MKQSKLKSMTTDELWTLHEAVADALTAKITAEKRELEQRLHQISMRSGAHIRACCQNIAIPCSPQRHGLAAARNPAG
jgi:hypothetical protein